MQIDTFKHCAISSLITLAVVSTVFVVATQPNEYDVSLPYDAHNEAQCSDKNATPIVTAQPFIDAVNAKTDFTHTNNVYTSEPNGEIADGSIVNNEKICTIDCIRSLIDNISTGEMLSGPALTLASHEAQNIANLLQENPELIDQLEVSLSATKIPKQRDLLVFILSKLPKERLLQSAQRLTYSSKPEDRIAGLSLLEASIDAKQAIGEELAVFISNETDNNVLVRALSVINELPADTIDNQTQDKLSTLIDNSEDEKLISAALLAKISVVSNDEDVRANINNVLQNQSENLNLLGLQGLAKVFERQQYDPNRGNWHLHTEVRDNVFAIANNTDASPALRIEALYLMNRHYSDSQ